MVVECDRADMAELADAPDLGSGSERSEGSSPFIRIRLKALYINSSRFVIPLRIPLSAHPSLNLLS